MSVADVDLDLDFTIRAAPQPFDRDLDLDFTIRQLVPPFDLDLDLDFKIRSLGQFDLDLDLDFALLAPEPTISIVSVGQDLVVVPLYVKSSGQLVDPSTNELWAP